ncbi:MAG: hypothetical protein AAF675_05805 [Pseudomonadota bacterium]
MRLKDGIFVLANFAAVYPTATLLLMGLGSVAPDLSMPLRTLLMTGVMVPAMTLVVIPAIRRTVDRHFV